MQAFYKGEPLDKSTKGDKLSGEMKTIVRNLPKGSFVTFYNIIARGPDGKPNNIGSIKR